MRLTTPSDDLLQGKSHIKVLRALSRLPAGIDVSVREVARRAGISHPTASTVLDSLLRQGVVHVRRSLVADEYGLNVNHVAVKEVQRLFRWEARLFDGVAGFLKKEIRERVPSLTELYLFGSALRPDMRPESDLDLAATCPQDGERKLIDALEIVSDSTWQRYGNRIHAVVGTRPAVEMAQRGRPGYRLWRGIVKEGRLLFPDRRLG